MRKIKLLIGLLVIQLSVIESFGQAYNNNTNLGVGSINPSFSPPLATDQYGTWCTGIGYLALNKHATGGYFIYLDEFDAIKNTAIGAYAMRNTTIGSFNTSVGYNTLSQNISGYKNVALGNEAMQTTTTGHNNIAVGCLAMGSATSSPTHNIAIGSEALRKIRGDRNIGIGFESLYDLTEGHNNVALGYRAMARTGQNTHDNIALGYFALNNTEGPRNIAIGSQAAVSTTTGWDNIAIGQVTLGYNTTGTGNVAVGNLSQYSSISGLNNVSLGYKSLYANLSHNNIGIGRQALSYNTTGHSNVAVGTFSGLGVIAYNNTVSIGYAASATSSNSIHVGNASISSITGYASFTNISDERVKKNIEENVPGLEFITQLRPVTYNLDMDAIATITNTPDSLRLMEAEQLKAKELQCGFIAQEVEAAANELEFDFHGVDKPENDNDPYGLRYSEFVVPLVKSVQELNEQNELLQKQNEALLAQFEELEQRINSLTLDTELQNSNQNNSGNFENKPQLFQNKPNPFSDQTTIEYYLPDEIQNAEIVIVSATGSIVKTIAISNTGRGSIIINANELQPGNYVYTLFIEELGKVDSKKFVVS